MSGGFLAGPGLAMGYNYLTGLYNDQRYDDYRAQEDRRREGARQDIAGGFDRATYGAPEMDPQFIENYLSGRPITRSDGTEMPPHEFRGMLERSGYDPATGQRREGVQGIADRLGGEAGGYYGGAGQRFQDTMDPSGNDASWGRLNAQGSNVGSLMMRGQNDRIANAQQQGGDIATGYGNMTSGMGAESQGLAGNYGTRLNEGMGMLAGAGEQERADINRRYDTFGAGQAQDAISRGLTGTTIAPAMQAANERERGGALGRSAERLRGQEANLYGRLSGDMLSAQGQDIGFRTGLQGQELANDTRQMGFEDSLNQQRINTFGGNRAFNYAAGANRLGQQNAMNAAQLSYGDQQFQQGQNAAWGYGMAPIDMGLQQTQALSNFDAGVTAPPPQMMQPINPSGGFAGSGYGGSDQQPVNVNVSGGGGGGFNPMDPMGMMSQFGG